MLSPLTEDPQLSKLRNLLIDACKLKPSEVPLRKSLPRHNSASSPQQISAPDYSYGKETGTPKSHEKQLSLPEHTPMCF